MKGQSSSIMYVLANLYPRGIKSGEDTIHGTIYLAEGYHQKYLDKNPDGCSHIPKMMFELKV